MLRTGSAGSNTVTDHLRGADRRDHPDPRPAIRRDLLITCDGAGATKDLLAHITTLNAAPGRRVHYSVGFDLDEALPDRDRQGPRSVCGSTSSTPTAPPAT